MRLTSFSVLALMFAVVLAGCARPEPSIEQRAQRLDKQIICPVCPGETLDQSNVQIAKDMRELIRERLAAAQSEDEIKQYFVERYGTRILAEPPASGVSLAVWIVPPAALLAGAAALYLVIREMRRRRLDRARAQSGERGVDLSLDRYIEVVDEDLRAGRTGRG